MRIAIVNDLPMAVEALRRVVASLPDAELAWVAKDGQEAVAECRNDTPDVVLMDIVMPVMDGAEATRLIMQQSACPILVTTATIQGNADKVFQALGHGALDAVDTPVLGLGGDLRGADQLVKKLRQVAILSRKTGPVVSHAQETAPAPRPSDRLPPLVAVGASTGGPQALCVVLQALRHPTPFPVIIVQHLGTSYVPGLAEWLSNETQSRVQVVQPGRRPQPGITQIACTEDHLVLDQNGLLQYVREPEHQIYRPSVDAFFASLCTAPIEPGAAVLLTGMGRDGAASMKSLRGAGWDTIAQDEPTSVVWGMPGAASKLGAASRILPVGHIGQAITDSMQGDKHER